jgi:hypothetical protein
MKQCLYDREAEVREYAAGLFFHVASPPEMEKIIADPKLPDDSRQILRATLAKKYSIAPWKAAAGRNRDDPD